MNRIEQKVRSARRRLVMARFGQALSVTLFAGLIVATLAIALPALRFMDVDFEEKLVTIFHELWHVSPRFDGDLRRHPGRCYMHTGSQKDYDAQMLRLARRWLRSQLSNSSSYLTSKPSRNSPSRAEPTSATWSR